VTWQRPGHPYGTILRVHDGDTPIMDVDLGLDTWRKSIGVRLTIDTRHWINARELADPGGVEARDNLAFILTVGSVWPLVTFSWDAYANRVDADVMLPVGSLAQWLVDQQWAAPWDGKSQPRPLPPWPRP
jgi:hypothetical protein